jgi:hypothetical protein
VIPLAHIGGMPVEETLLSAAPVGVAFSQTIGRDLLSRLRERIGRRH